MALLIDFCLCGVGFCRKKYGPNEEFTAYGFKFLFVDGCRFSKKTALQIGQAKRYVLEHPQWLVENCQEIKEARKKLAEKAANFQSETETGLRHKVRILEGEITNLKNSRARIRDDLDSLRKVIRLVSEDDNSNS